MMATKAVQVILDGETLRAVDREARRAKVNRSELFRRALAVYMEQLQVRALEACHRAGYAKYPEQPDEFRGFEVVWPEK